MTSRAFDVLLFGDPHAALAAVRRLRGGGYRVRDVYSPYPLRGMSEALGERDTRLGWATFTGGALGGTVGLGFMVYTHAIDWVRNIGGKSPTALPALVPVAFELTVLLAALATALGLLLAAGLRPRWSAPSLPDRGVLDDRIAVVVVPPEPTASDVEHAAYRQLCAELAPAERVERWQP